MLRQLAEFLPFYVITFFVAWLYFLVGTIVVHRDLHRRPSRLKGKLPFRWIVAAIAFTTGALAILSVIELI